MDDFLAEKERRDASDRRRLSIIVAVPPIVSLIVCSVCYAYPHLVRNDWVSLFLLFIVFVSFGSFATAIGHVAWSRRPLTIDVVLCLILNVIVILAAFGGCLFAVAAAVAWF